MDFPLLCKIFAIPNRQLIQALEVFECFAAFMEAPLGDIQPFTDQKSFASICAWRRSARLPDAYTKNREILDLTGARTLGFSDRDYPPLLAEIASPPAVLFVTGSLDKLILPQIAIVGSRRPTLQGIDLAKTFSSQLGQSGFAVTSGLALGIDGAAHRGAMDAGAPTFAVMGTGPDQIYPARHRALANEILSSGGGLITEFMPGSPPLPQHFPQRNRIVTGLGLGVLVVEASERSGSLISARLAAEQGRAVCAIPGNVRSPVAAGCNLLIREGATLVTSPEQIVEQLPPLLGFQYQKRAGQVQETTGKTLKHEDAEHWLLKTMGFDVLTADQLCGLSGRSAAEVTTALAELELAGRLSQTAYGYQRTT